MKRVGFLFVSLFSCAQPNTEEVTMQPQPNPEISAAINAFVQAADTRDAEKMEAILDPNFRVIFATGGNVSALDRATYVSLLQAGKIGGDQRSVSFHDTQLDGLFAHAKATITSPKATFESQYTLIQRDGSWRLLQDATVFTPSKP
jgi:hypothetical protein